MGFFSKVGEMIGGASSGTIGVVGSVITAVAQPFNTWQQRKTEEATAAHLMTMKRFEFNTNLIMSTESHNAQWELDSLKIKTRSPMQWISYLMLLSPFIIAWFNPDAVNLYFTVSMNTIPDWFVQAFVSVTGVIWGVSQMKNVATGIKTTLMERKQMAHTANIEIEKIKSTIATVTENALDNNPEVISNVLCDVELHELYPELTDDK